MSWQWEKCAKQKSLLKCKQMYNKSGFAPFNVSIFSLFICMHVCEFQNQKESKNLCYLVTQDVCIYNQASIFPSSQKKLQKKFIMWSRWWKLGSHSIHFHFVKAALLTVVKQAKSKGYHDKTCIFWLSAGRLSYFTEACLMQKYIFYISM